jgi:hypothetical protein
MRQFCCGYTKSGEKYLEKYLEKYFLLCGKKEKQPDTISRHFGSISILHWCSCALTAIGWWGSECWMTYVKDELTSFCLIKRRRFGSFHGGCRTCFISFEFLHWKMRRNLVDTRLGGPCPQQRLLAKHLHELLYTHAGTYSLYFHNNKIL